MSVNHGLLDEAKSRAETQPMVDKNKTETFPDRFERLRGGMSYQALSDGIYRKTGMRISPQAMHKWSRGGGIDQDTAKLVAEFFGVHEAWLLFGTGPESILSLEHVLDALPDPAHERTVDFIKYQIERNATETELFVKEPAKLTEYLKFIDRLITARKEKK